MNTPFIRRDSFLNNMERLITVKGYYTYPVVWDMCIMGGFTVVITQSKGSLTGYGGGHLEQLSIYINELVVPVNNTLLESNPSREKDRLENENLYNRLFWNVTAGNASGADYFPAC